VRSGTGHQESPVADRRSSIGNAVEGGDSLGYRSAHVSERCFDNDLSDRRNSAPLARLFSMERNVRALIAIRQVAGTGDRCPENETNMHGLDEMYLFRSVVDCGGLSAAGRRLGIAKSTVARRIADMEIRLGLPLFHRGTNRFALTNFGAEC